MKSTGDWDLKQVQQLPKALSAEMKNEVKYLSSLDEDLTSTTPATPRFAKAR